MVYDSQYYEERRKELEADFNKKVSTGLQKIFNCVGEVQADLQEIQRKFQEIANKEKAGQEKDKGVATKKAEELLKTDAGNKKSDTK
jgi:uncharacterized protein YoxC